MGCCFSSEYSGQNGLPFTKVGDTPLTESKGVNHVFSSEQTANSSAVITRSSSGRKMVIAMYDYTPPEEGLYLGIAKGEKLEVMEAHDADWWRVRSQKTGREGYVPTNYIADDSSVESEEWFVGNVSRKEAEDLLMKPGNDRGTYLIRHSEQNPGSYALSIKDIDENMEEKVKHYKVHIHPETGEYYLAPRQGFASLRALVNACKTNKHGLCHLLTKPCPNQKPPIWDLSLETRDHWELNRNDIQLIRRLGSGHFGVVWYGLWKGRIEVAVKTMKPGSTSTECFLKEASIMKKFRHDRIVTLYGVCTREEPIYIVTEFMCKGSLLDLLRSPEGGTLTFEQLLYIGSQVASGMAYLEKLALVHRDLAARNIVVGENNVAKVADFGLARVTENNEYFRREGTQVPVKWTAPEVIHYGKYSIKSDVWSFGILLMELFTYGQEPYPGMNKSQVIKKLETGYRMPKPHSITFPDSLYKLLVLPCWDSDAERRPTFIYAHRFLDDFMVSTDSPSRHSGM